MPRFGSIFRNYSKTFVSDLRTKLETESAERTKTTIARIKREVESEEGKKIDLLQSELVQKKHENQRLQERITETH